MSIINSSADKRREEILSILKEDKKAKVSDLKDKFGISNVTIGSDLNHLEKKGLVIRSFGYVEYKENFINFQDKADTKNFEVKKRIAKRAQELINDNEVILLYMGSTVNHLVNVIGEEKNLIAVTNSMKIAYETGLKPNIKTIMLGGYYNAETYSTFGEQAMKQLKEYNIDKLFISPNGISVQGGVTIDQPFEAELNRYIITNAKQVIMLADHTKIGIIRFIRVALVTDIDILITDSEALADKVQEIIDKGVAVIIA